MGHPADSQVQKRPLLDVAPPHRPRPATQISQLYFDLFLDQKLLTSALTHAPTYHHGACRQSCPSCFWSRPIYYPKKTHLHLTRTNTRTRTNTPPCSRLTPSHAQTTHIHLPTRLPTASTTSCAAAAATRRRSWNGRCAPPWWTGGAPSSPPGPAGPPATLACCAAAARSSEMGPSSEMGRSTSPTSPSAGVTAAATTAVSQTSIRHPGIMTVAVAAPPSYPTSPALSPLPTPQTSPRSPTHRCALSPTAGG